MSETIAPNPAAVALSKGDTIKFQFLGHLPETGHYQLSRLRERIYFEIMVSAVNDEAITPRSLEVGIFKDQLPPTMRMEMRDEQLMVDIQDVDFSHYLTAQLADGLPKMVAENSGKWLADLKPGFFLVPSTLRDTGELAPVCKDVSTEPHPKSAAAPDAPNAPAKTRRCPWWTFGFGS